MKIFTWNVNGLRACVKKGFMDFFEDVNADIFCVQETKLSEGDIAFEMPAYKQYWNYADKKGYSGTAVFTKQEPIAATYGIGMDEHDREGRVITLEFDKYYLVNVYTPNSQDELKRLSYRMQWEDDFRAYLQKLDGRKPVILCGDLNVAHTEIDLKNPSTNRRNAGFTDEEREKFTQLLNTGFIDVYRFLNPKATGKYTYWSYRFGARERNAGWRIDYTCVSRALKNDISGAAIHSEVLGSDHCPISLEVF
jgi:exodeoxyribonuclease-3